MAVAQLKGGIGGALAIVGATMAGFMTVSKLVDLEKVKSNQPIS